MNTLLVLIKLGLFFYNVFDNGWKMEAQLFEQFDLKMVGTV